MHADLHNDCVEHHGCVLAWQVATGTQGGNSYAQQQLAASPRQTSEYQAALELEIWKETQQQIFEKEVLWRLLVLKTTRPNSLLLLWCFTSTETVWFIRDGGRMG